MLIPLITFILVRTLQLVAGITFITTFAWASAHASLNEADDALYFIEVAFTSGCAALALTAIVESLRIALRSRTH